jgi:hypothetical protein
MVTPEVAQLADDACYTAKHVDAAFLLLSYQPGMDHTYPEGRPLFRLPLINPDD